MRRARVLAGWWFSLLFLWVVLTESLDPSEVTVGAGASLVAVGAIQLIIERSDAYFQLRIGWLVELWRLPMDIGRDSLMVIAALFRHPRRLGGSYHTVRLDVPGDDPEAAARRAFEIFKVSAAPNSFVIDFNPEDNTLLVHRLLPARGEAR